MSKLAAWVMGAFLCTGASAMQAAEQMAAQGQRAEFDEKPVLDGTVDPASLRLVVDGEGARLVGDLILTLVPGASIAAAQNGRGAPIQMRQESPLNRDESRVRLREIDLSSGSVLGVTFASGYTMSGRLPGLAVGSELTAGHITGSATETQLDAAWKDVLASLGAQSVPRPAGFAYLSRWNLAAAPHFAATKEDRASREDLNEVASILNRGVYQRGDTAALTLDRAIAATQWRDGTTAAEKSTGKLVHASIFEDGQRPLTRSVHFTLRDVFGRSLERRVTIHSHGLLTARSEELAPLVAALAGVDQGSLAAPDPDDPDASYLPLAIERSALNRLFVRSVQDGIVTPDELGVQVRLARQISSP